MSDRTVCESSRSTTISGGCIAIPVVASAIFLKTHIISSDPKQVDGISDVVRSPVVLEGEAEEVFAEDDRHLAAGAIVESTDGSELIRKPIVIESRSESEVYIELAPESKTYDGRWFPKNINMETMES